MVRRSSSMNSMSLFAIFACAATLVLLPLATGGCADMPAAQGGVGQAGPPGIPGAPGEDGLDCFDLNNNGVGDPEEDTNNDGIFNALDCQTAEGAAPGQPGAPGQDGQDGQDGLDCFDINGNRVGDADEDTNNDGTFDARDCQGPPGPPGVVDGEVNITAGQGIIVNNTQISLDTNFTDTRYDERYWQLGGNAGTNPDTEGLGTTDNTTLNMIVNGDSALRLVPTAAGPNVIGGFSGNTVNDNVTNGTIAGGGTADSGDGDPSVNTVTGNFGAIGGGIGNTASLAAVVGGGQQNQATGSASTIAGGFINEATNDNATVGGGFFNRALGPSSTVAGGFSNRAIGIQSAVIGGTLNAAEGLNSMVAGGNQNTASGAHSFVAGGSNNTASANFSFAGGQQATADDVGSFVWLDSNNVPQSSFAPNSILMRASGGVRIFSNNVGSLGVTLLPGQTTWASTCDRNLKENITPVDKHRVLERLMDVPISTYNMKGAEASNKIMGLMAQDFYAAYKLGTGDKYVGMLDLAAVSMASVQALNEIVQEKDCEIAELEERLAKLEALVKRMGER